MNTRRNNGLPPVAKDLQHKLAVLINEVFGLDGKVSAKERRPTRLPRLVNAAVAHGLRHTQRRLLVIIVEANNAFAETHTNASPRLRCSQRVRPLLPAWKKLEPIILRHITVWGFRTRRNR